MGASPSHVVFRKRWLPTYSEVHVKRLSNLDLILTIDTVVFLPQAYLHGVSISQEARPAQKKVGQRIVR